MGNNTQFRESLAKRLTALRRARGLSIKDVAKAVGKKWQAYAAHEEARSMPSLLEAKKLRVFYGMGSIDELMEVEGDLQHAVNQ